MNDLKGINAELTVLRMLVTALAATHPNKAAVLRYFDAGDNIIMSNFLPSQADQQTVDLIQEKLEMYRRMIG